VKGNVGDTMGGIVKTVTDAYTKFSKKTAADRVGTRYGAVKNIAVDRYLDNVNPFVIVREIVREILESEGVPPAQHGSYYAFAFQLVSKALKHSGESLKRSATGLKAKFTTLGLDPAILSKIAAVLGLS